MGILVRRGFNVNQIPNACQARATTSRKLTGGYLRLRAEAVEGNICQYFLNHSFRSKTICNGRNTNAKVQDFELVFKLRSFNRPLSRPPGKHVRKHSPKELESRLHAYQCRAAVAGHQLGCLALAVATLPTQETFLPLRAC